MRIPEEIKALRRGLESFLGETCYIRDEMRPAAVRLYRFGGNHGRTVYLDGRNVLAMPVPDRHDFWLSAEARTGADDRGEESFARLSIAFMYLELPSSQAGVSLFRIEWERDDRRVRDAIDDGSAIAQPHWHVYSGDGERKMDRLHLAVAARWHDQSIADPTYLGLESGCLEAWVEGVLRHVSGQLRYLSRRRSA